MAVLVACEESQAVTIKFRELGIEAFSCDIMPTSGPNPDWHIQQDVSSLLHDNWDMILAFPPCTHIASSGAKHFAAKKADGRQQEGIDFFMLFTDLPCPKVAIENPVGIMSRIYRKPDQIIHPYMFGDPHSKKTCLWLKGLPLLQPTNIVEKEPDVVFSSGARMAAWYNATKSSKVRSKTFPGIAKAMADQWGEML